MATVKSVQCPNPSLWLSLSKSFQQTVILIQKCAPELWSQQAGLNMTSNAARVQLLSPLLRPGKRNPHRCGRAAKRNITPSPPAPLSPATPFANSHSSILVSSYTDIHPPSPHLILLKFSYRPTLAQKIDFFLLARCLPFLQTIKSGGTGQACNAKNFKVKPLCPFACLAGRRCQQ